MLAGYLAAERDLGRVAADADVDMLAGMLLGSAHLLFADRESGPPAHATVHKIVAGVLAGHTVPSG